LTLASNGRKTPSHGRDDDFPVALAALAAGAPPGRAGRVGASTAQQTASLFPGDVQFAALGRHQVPPAFVTVFRAHRRAVRQSPPTEQAQRHSHRRRRLPRPRRFEPLAPLIGERQRPREHVRHGVDGVAEAPRRGQRRWMISARRRRGCGRARSRRADRYSCRSRVAWSYRERTTIRGNPRYCVAQKCATR
jgi:hypothetical protein